MLLFDKEIIDKAHILIHAVNHKHRRDILKIIMENEGVTVTDIYVKMRVEQSVCSMNLGVLRKAGLLTYVKKDKKRFYQVDRGMVEKVERILRVVLA